MKPNLLDFWCHVRIVSHVHATKKKKEIIKTAYYTLPLVDWSC